MFKKILLVILIFIGIASLAYIILKSEIPKDEPVESILNSIDQEGDRIIFGKIIKIKNDKIILETGKKLKSVAIKVDVDSIIYKINQKDEDQYRKEMEEFSKKMQEQMDNPSMSVDSMPPNMFMNEEIGVNDLSVNQQAQVIIEVKGNNIVAREVFAQ